MNVPTALRLLLIDDNPDDRALVIRQLARELPGLDAREITDDAALTRALAEGGFDLVITDYHLQWTDGLAVLRAVKTRTPHCPVIMFTGTGNEELAVRAMQAGLDDYVLKSPKHYIRLPAAVRLALDRAHQRRAREQAEEGLRLFRALIDRSNDTIEVVDPDTGRFLDVNEKGCLVLGYSRDELLALSVVDVDPMLDQASFTRAVEGLRKSGVLLWEGLHRRKDGSVFPVEVNISHVRLDREYAVAVVRDITERKRAEGNLRREKSFSEEMIESLPGVFYLFDADGRFLRWNQEFERVSGYSADEFARLHPLDFFREDDRALIEQRIGEVFVKGWSSAEAELVAKDGTRTPYHFVGRKVTVEERPCLVGMGYDITERKRAEQALSENEARYRTLTEATFDGILVAENGVIREANDGFAAMHGYTVAEVLGRNAMDFIAEGSREFIAQQIRTEAEGRFEIVGLRKDGRTIQLEAVVKTRPYRGSRTALVALRDVTEQKRLEEQFRHAQKMEAVGRLAGGVAHDFNNVLTAITGYGDLLLDELPQDSPLRQDVDEIRKAATRASSLTRQLLAFSRKQILVPQVLDVNALVADLDKLLRRLLGEDVDLVTKLDPALVAVRADPGQLEQVIVNLAVNARDAMPEGGKLTIESKNAELDEAYAVDHTPVKPGRYVLLAVSDTGTGIPAEIQSRIFEPFFTTKEMGKGTGLGLSTVYGIVKQSEGYIWVYSELGHGTTFKVYLPRVSDPVQQVAQRPTGKPAGGPETVLLVEDEEQVRRLARRVLEAYGYTVLDAMNGEQAVALATQHGGPVHLLMTDVVLPGASGRKVADELLALRPGMKVLYMSGYTEDAIVHRGVLEPETAFLHKPFTPDALARKVREVLDARPQG
jgi:two-component system cell cycle sensor histidine kinase/response regulator CckA